MGRKKKALKKIEEIEKRGLPELDAASDLASKNPDVEGIPAFNEEIASNDNSISQQPLVYKPEFPYRGNQIIIDSGRVLLNSKEDSTFIVGKKAVGISSGGTVNIDSNGKCIINSPQIDLGLNASHPVIYGDDFLTVLNSFLVVVDTIVCENLKIASDANGVSIATVQRAGKTLQEATRNLANKLPGTLSELVKIQ